MHPGLLFAPIALAGTALLAAAAGRRRWESATTALGRRLDAGRRPGDAAAFDPAGLAGLPPPLQRYFRAVLAPGQRSVAAVTLEQAGTFNLSGTTAAWKPFTAFQRVVVRRPGYFWDARIRQFPGVTVHVRDAYIAGEGLLQAAIAGLIPVARQRDRGELARGELLRLLAERVWYPTALLPGQGVCWEGVDGHSARATLRDGALAVTLLFRFNDTGLIDTVRAGARSRLVGGVAAALPWECRLGHYAVREGLRIPLEGEVAWLHPAGPRPYWRGRITRLTCEFDP